MQLSVGRYLAWANLIQFNLLPCLTVAYCIFQQGSDSDDAAMESEYTTTPKQTQPKAPAYRFTLRVALRPRTPAAGHRSEEEMEEEEDGDDDEEKEEYNVKEEQCVKVKKEQVKPEIKKKAVTKATQKKKIKTEMEEELQWSGSESETDGPLSFLDKRAQNIKANKAMVG